MKIHEFIAVFPDENACREHYRSLRETKGITCKKCGSKNHYWIKSKSQWQCCKCRFRTTLRSGTCMQHAHLPLRKWYLCLALMSCSKKGLSTKEIQRQMGHSRYRTIWELMQKIRMSLGKEEKEMRMMVQHFMIQNNVASPGSTDMTFNQVEMRLIFNESTHYPLKIKGLFSPKPEFVSGVSKNGLSLNSSYSYDFKSNVKKFNSQSKSKWARIHRSNFNRLIVGIHHRVSLVYLQNYLDEFCFRINHKNNLKSMFDTYLNTIVKHCLWYRYDHS